MLSPNITHIMSVVLPNMPTNVLQLIDINSIKQLRPNTRIIFQGSRRQPRKKDQETKRHKN